MMMKTDLQVVLVLVGLMVVSGGSAVLFMGSATWSGCLAWWAVSMVSLFSFWFLGVHPLVRLAVLALSSVAVAHQYYHHYNHNVIIHTVTGGVGGVLVAALVIVVVSVVMSEFQYLAEVVWSVKTIVIDWLVCTSLLVILTCIDALQGGQYLVLAVAYFCSSNIFSVMVMKACEALMKWRSPRGAPCAKYIHNLSVPITLLPSLHPGQLLVVAWALVLLLVGRAVEPEMWDKVRGWQVTLVGGLWGSLFCYVCPLSANKSPTPHQPSPRPTSSARLQQQS